jgi:pyruvate dehydrogenase E1 component
MYLFESHAKKGKKKLPRVQLLGAGAILNEVRAAATLLLDEYGVESDVWSVTSFNELAREGQKAQRWNRLNPDKPAKPSYVETCFDSHDGPVVASTDYIRMYAEQIRPFIDREYTVLGTDGFGRSDTREKLRQFFEVDRYHVVVAALDALRHRKEVDVSVVMDAIRKFDIDRNCLSPMHR